MGEILTLIFAVRIQIFEKLAKNAKIYSFIFGAKNPNTSKLTIKRKF